jgi:hypothetical protein
MLTKALEAYRTVSPSPALGLGAGGTPREARTTMTAVLWLKRKIGWAPPDHPRAQHFAGIMRADLWKPREIEPVEPKVEDDGSTELQDGQHRLTAVVIANMPVELLVRFY